MERAGFPAPTTVANFLLRGELADGTVIVVDEAGQIGGRQMHQLLQLVRERNARMILSLSLIHISSQSRIPASFIPSALSVVFWWS